MKHEDIDKLRSALDCARSEKYGNDAAAVYDAAVDDIIAKLDELAALRERGRWRPIEEAPTRTFVLVAFADGRRPEISRHDKASHVSLYGWLDYSTLDGEDIEFYRDGPTHWLPLPEAPR